MYIVFHFYIDKIFVVVPFEAKATVEASSPVNGALVLGFNGIKEAEGVVF